MDSYLWDEDNNQANVEKHGISFQRASVALEEGNPVNSNVIDKDKGRYDTIAYLNGEAIKVVYEKNGDDIYIISAHKRRTGEQEYEERAVTNGVEKNLTENKEFAEWKNRI